MAQTLCVSLHFDPAKLEELNDTFTSASTIGCLDDTSSATAMCGLVSSFAEMSVECGTIARQVRSQFSKIVSGLITLGNPGMTVTEEWPVALEFSGWASDDCVEFCNSHGLINDLRECRNELNRIFSNIKNSTAELDYYQEIDVDDEGHVVIRLEIESDRRTYRDEYKSWVSWSVDNLSDESRMLISVSVDRL